MTAFPPAILAEVDVGFGRAQLIEWLWPTPMDELACEDVHAIELSLPPLATDATASFPAFEKQGSCFMGGLFFRPAGVAIRARAIGGRIRVVRVVAEPQAVASYIPPDRLWTIGELRACMNIRNERIRRLLDLVHRELIVPDLAATDLIGAYSKALVIEAARFLEAPPAAFSESRLAAWQYRRICERLEQDGAPPTARELAEICGVGPRHLLRLFRNLTGETVSAYIQKTQIRRGQRLLLDGTVSLKQIADRLGYSDSSAFSKAFKRHVGESPDRFRRRRAAGSIRERLF